MRANAFLQKKKNIQSQPKSAASKQQAFQLKDQRPEASIQRQFIEAANNRSEKSTQLKTDNPKGVVQRYTIVNPNDYLTHDDGQKPMFPSNQFENERITTKENDVESTVSKRNWIKRYSNNPPLKVSKNGILALESTVGQPQVFYGESSSIQNFSQRLINIKSRVTLAEEPGASVTTPKDPLNPQGATQNLVRVKPVHSPHIDPNLELMDNHICSDVSEKIVGGKHMVTGDRIGNEKVHESLKLSHGIKISRVLNGMDERDTTKGFDDAWENDRDPLNMNIEGLEISPKVEKYFDSGFLGIRIKPSDRILRALSIEGTPDELLEQVYKIYDHKKTKNNKYTEAEVFDHVIAYFKIKNTIRYRKTRDNENLKKAVGINEMTAPEVGESFSSFGIAAPQTMDEKGIIGHGVNLTEMTDPETEKVIKDYLILQSSSKKLGMLAKSEYKKAKGLVLYGDHHGAVVAKDGPDTITFENFNRGQETNLLKEELWSEWFTGQEEFNKEVNMEVRQMIKNVRQEEENPNYDNHLRNLRSFNKKLLALERFQQGFVDLTSQVRAKFETNIESEQNNLWHFNMYGAGGQTFTDEEGNVKGQSFHEAWSKGVPNTLTVRTTGLMDDEQKNNLRKKVYHLVYQYIRNDGFTNPLSSYDTIKNLLLQNIEIPKKKIEYSDTLIALEFQEQQGGALSPQEKLEAEALFTAKKPMLLGILLFLNQEARHDDPKRMFFAQLYNSLSTPVNDDSDDDWNE